MPAASNSVVVLISFASRLPLRHGDEAGHRLALLGASGGRIERQQRKAGVFERVAHMLGRMGVAQGLAQARAAPAASSRRKSTRLPTTRRSYRRLRRAASIIAGDRSTPTSRST